MARAALKATKNKTIRPLPLPGRLGYLVLLLLAAPLWLGQTLYKSIRLQNLRYLRQRLGIFKVSDLPPANQTPIWFHCVSVGEVNAVLPLAISLHKKRPDRPIIFTTVTTTSAELLEKRLGNSAYHVFAPVDSVLMWTNFLRKISPKCLLVVETELWLNLFRLCSRRKIPLFLVNARFTDKKISWSKPLLHYYRACLNCVTHIFARSAEDGQRYHRLGAQTKNISVIPNLKWGARFPDKLPNLIQRPYLLAASTHKGEDEIVMEAFRLSGTDDHLLVIAPRHPQRGKKIQALALALDYKAALRSAGELPAGKQLYIADTIGELPALIQHATLVFTGGSLLPCGGQNVLEAAMLGTPQVTGPYTKNFLPEAAVLEKCTGLLRVHNASELGVVFRKATRKSGAFRKMAARAKHHVQSSVDPVATYLRELEKFGIA